MNAWPSFCDFSDMRCCHLIVQKLTYLVAFAPCSILKLTQFYMLPMALFTYKSMAKLLGAFSVDFLLRGIITSIMHPDCGAIVVYASFYKISMILVNGEIIGVKGFFFCRDAANGSKSSIFSQELIIGLKIRDWFLGSY